jgi:hypothetical protein
MAAGKTYEPIATNTLSSSAATVTFSSISGSYTDLIIICSVKGSASNGTIQVRFNGDTGTNYSYTRMYGVGSGTPGTDRSSNVSSMQLEDAGASFSGQFIVARGFINNYSNSTTYKTMIGRGDEVGNVTMATSNLWRNSSAITSITIFTPSNDFISGSTFTLYGIAAA